MIELSPEQYKLLFNKETESIMIDGGKFEGTVGEIVKVFNGATSDHCFIYLIAVRKRSIKHNVLDGYATIEQIESWIGEVKDRRETELGKHIVTTIQYERLNASYKKLIGKGVSEVFDICYAFLHDDSKENIP